MKIVFKIITVITIITTLISCSSSNNDKGQNTRTIIYGKIITPNARNYTHEVSIHITDYRTKTPIYISEIKDDGTFKFEFDLYKTQDINIQPKVGRILLSPGDSIFVNIDLNRAENITFEGSSKINNKIIVEYLHSNYSRFRTKNAHTSKMTPIAYKNYLIKERKKIDHRKRLFFDKHNPSDEIKIWIENFIDITYYKALLKFPPQYCNINRINYKEWKAPEGYFDGINAINKIADNDVINSDMYTLVNLYNWYYLPSRLDKRVISQSNIDSLLFISINQHNSNAIRELLFADIFFTYLNVDSLNRFDNNRSLFEKEITSSYLSKPLESYYSIKQEELRKSSLVAEVLELNAEENILQQIVSDHKGSNIYIDFWATWCNPCIQEFSYSKQLYQSYDMTNIDFVFVCLNSKKNDWKKKLEELKIPGRHYFCNEKQSEVLRKELNIEMIPYYALINKEGQLSDKGNHLKPSVPLTLKKINNLLQP